MIGIQSNHHKNTFVQHNMNSKCVCDTIMSNFLFMKNIIRIWFSCIGSVYLLNSQFADLVKKILEILYIP